MTLRRSLGIASPSRMMQQHIPVRRLVHKHPIMDSRPLNVTKYNSLHRGNAVPSCIRTFGISTSRCASTTTVRVPTMAESITEGTIAQFTKRVGDTIEQDEELATIETDKIDVSVNAPHYGKIQKLLVEEGDRVTVDQAIAEIDEAEVSFPETKETAGVEKLGPSEETRTVSSSSSSSPQSPPAQNTSSTSKASDTAGSSPQPPSQGPATSQGKKSRGEDRVKMTRIRQKTAQHLKASQNTAAFLTTFNEVNMSGIMKFRKTYRDAVMERHGIKLGMMGAMARASVLALKEIPAVNASIENGDTVVYRDYVDLSVAASIPKGLVTPVLRNIESMSIVQIEKGIAELVKKARDGKLTMDDLMGGSFTISNSGIWGSLFGTPIINMPQTAVLGTYGIQDRPVAINGQVEIRPMMYIALTYDHRIIDGREAVTFLNLVKKFLEQPESMLLE